MARKVALGIVIILIDARAVPGTADVAARPAQDMLIRAIDAPLLRGAFGIAVPMDVQDIATQTIVVPLVVGLVDEALLAVLGIQFPIGAAVET